ncbi:MAG: DUF697 domain-containing protein [Desulfamplus sp.]|nr:DUF697 domain-containing protein [Desulfamplus sp.]
MNHKSANESDKTAHATEEVKSETMKKETLSESEFKERLQKAEQATRKRVYAAVGAGLIPLPVIDFIALTGIQMELVQSLCKIYDVPFMKNIGKTLVTTLVGGGLPVHASPFLASLVKNIPLIGTTTGAVTLSVVGGSCTYAIGKVFTQHFESGGTLLNFDPEEMRDYFQSYYKEGEKIATEVTSK